MTVLFLMIPVALLMGLGGLLAFVGATRGGQYDDLDTPALRAILEDSERKPRT